MLRANLLRSVSQRTLSINTATSVFTSRERGSRFIEPMSTTVQMASIQRIVCTGMPAD